MIERRITNMKTVVHRTWFRNLRLEKGLSRKELGEKFGVTANYIGDIEHGRRNPSSPLALKLSKELGFTLEQIVSDAKPYYTTANK